MTDKIIYSPPIEKGTLSQMLFNEAAGSVNAHLTFTGFSTKEEAQWFCLHLEKQIQRILENGGKISADLFNIIRNGVIKQREDKILKDFNPTPTNKGK